MSHKDPTLHPVRLADLRPTQMTVGMREVAEKRQAWRGEHGKRAGDFLGEHMIPVLRGPAKRFYVIDHHHLGRALLEEGVEKVLVNVVADLAKLDRTMFWTVCEHRGWVHPYDAKGHRCDLGELPKSLADLADDPYRSLAGAVRHGGGFAKDLTPFAEFLWAEFLRRRITRKAMAKDFDGAVAEALGLARSSEADFLPGWCGPS